MNGRRRRLAAKLIALFVVTSMSMAVVGCTDADYQLYVRNNSSQAWLIRSASGGSSSRTYVNLIDPGTEGLVAAWEGELDHTIELLNEDCSVAGIFEITEGDRVLVPGVDGIDGSIAPYRFNDRWNVPWIRPTSDCGGFVEI